jgi:hypothetical protein
VITLYLPVMGRIEDQGVDVVDVRSRFLTLGEVYEPDKTMLASFSVYRHKIAIALSISEMAEKYP